MKLVQKLTYKLAKPVTMLAIAGASMFASCSKDNDDGLKGKRTVYKFSAMDASILNDLEQIQASADSAEVVEIEFQLDKDNYSEWQGANMQYFYDHAIIPAFQAAKGKGKGSGIYKGVDDDAENRAIEPKYKALGFKGFTYQKQKQY